MEHITSRSNKKIVDTLKLRNKKYRDRTSLFTFEGYKVFCEARSAGIEFSDVFVREDAMAKYPELADTEHITVVSESVYEKLTQDSSPDGIFCVAKKPGVLSANNGSKLIAVSVRDPGNIGTMIRTALAFGIGELILSEDCADIYSPKVVRAAMGALFRQKVITVTDIKAKIEEIKNGGYTVCATALNERSVPLSDIEITQRTCFVIGNEGHGLDTDIISLCDNQVIIPIDPHSESLNAAVAAAILMWEIKRYS